MTNPTQFWPEEAVTSLNKEMEKTPHGCGACGHAEWIYEGQKWTVGTCRQSVRLDPSKVVMRDELVPIAGNDPVMYCTAQNAGLSE